MQPDLAASQTVRAGSGSFEAVTNCSTGFGFRRCAEKLLDEGVKPGKSTDARVL